MRDVTPIPKARKAARHPAPMAERCELALRGCTGRATHRHHVVLRAQGGDGPTMDLCAPCHHEVHAHPAVAYANGWLRHPAPLAHRNPRAT